MNAQTNPIAEIKKLLESKGYMAVIEKDGGTAEAIAQPNDPNLPSCDFSGPLSKLAKWARGLVDLSGTPETEMSVEEWEAEFGHISDEDVAEALAVAEPPTEEAAPPEIVIAEEDLPPTEPEIVITEEDLGPPAFSIKAEEPPAVPETIRNTLLKAFSERVAVMLRYTDEKGRVSTRTVLPIAPPTYYQLLVDLDVHRTNINTRDDGKKKGPVTRRFITHRISAAILLPGTSVPPAKEKVGTYIVPITTRAQKNAYPLTVGNADKMIASGHWVAA